MTTNHLNRTTPAQTGGVGQTPERGPRAAKEKMGGEFFASGESSSGDEGVLQQILQNHTVPQPKTLQQAPSAASPTQAGRSVPCFDTLEAARVFEEGTGPGQEDGPPDEFHENPSESGGQMADAGTDDESCIGSVSVGIRDRDSSGQVGRYSFGHSVTTSTGSSAGSLKRWGARNWNKLKGDSSSQAMSIESNPDPDTEEKENPSSFAIVLPTRHDPECETASETVKALFRTLSDKDATEPYQPSIPSPKSPPVPGSWINRIWGRKDVEDMDRDIVKGLNDVGIDTEEYFKRDHTNFPSVAHYYVNLHERLNDRLDDEVVDLLTSLENRLGVDNPLVKAMHEVMESDGAPGANYSEALVLNVSIDNSGGSKVSVNYPYEESKSELGTHSIKEEDNEVDPESHSDMCSNKDSMQLDSDFIPMVPEMSHMRRDLDGLSWVVKRPSRRQLSIAASHSQDNFYPSCLPHSVSVEGNESMSSTTSRSVRQSTTASITFGVPPNPELESGARIFPRTAEAVKNKSQLQPPRAGLFRCCFGKLGNPQVRAL